MTKYYFVVSALPPIQLGMPPELSFKELRELVAQNLTARDFRQFNLLLEQVDIYNVKALWLGLPLDERGTILGKELEEALLVSGKLPTYVNDFVERYETIDDRLRYFSSLYVSMYQQKREGFLATYYAFEREVALVLTALRAKKTGRNIVRELQFEDPYDPLIADILSQKDAPDYIPPMEYEDLKAIFVENSSDSRKLYENILKYRFKKIGEWSENEHFTLGRILAYAARLLIGEKVMEVSEVDSKVAIENLSNG
ncbi:MAG TPA: DUF2764 family protein [Chlamydiales bacterium]|nr:DUF2764 family protein [Chlamydiales bacterium]